MLLYTRVAAPKAPKRRSRAGCTSCKEKKKKCDERRPQCARCAERSVACTYEAVRPRQRRKRGSDAGLPLDGQNAHESELQDDLWQLGDDIEEISRDDCISLGDSMADNSSIANTEYILSPATTTNSVLSFPEDDRDRSRHGSLVRRSSNFSAASNPLCLPPDLALIAPVLLASPTLDFCIPAFAEFSDRPNRRALVDHFCNVLSHLIVFREESGNPFQQLVLPLSHDSSPVMNAIYALASAHLEYRGVSMGEEKSLYFHNEAIQGLAQLIESGNKANYKNELLAAIMLLVYYEVVSAIFRCQVQATRPLTFVFS